MTSSATTTLTQVSTTKSHGGWQHVYRHESMVLGCMMNFGLFLPPQAKSCPCPVLYWLSGLTCTEQNFITKGGAQEQAAKAGLIVVAPDTSPRGEQVPDNEAYDLGQGAGFYLNATQPPWSEHFRMYDYITSELPTLVESSFPVMENRRSIFGHSMGGHGALTIALNNPTRYRSVSAFSPIVAPSIVPWGKKAFAAYLGEDQQAWQAHDATCLVKRSTLPGTILIDQGNADDFLAEQLKCELFEQACSKAGQALELRMQKGYDHSYYFIASFMADHVSHHAEALCD